MKKTKNQLRASKHYNNKNRELINKKASEYSKKNPEKVKLAKAKYKKENKDKTRAYYEKNKEKISKYGKERYALKKIEREVKKMFGRKNVKEEVPELPERVDLEIPVEQPKNAGMPGFTEDAPAPVAAPAPEPAPVAAPVPVPVAPPVAKKPAEQYQIIETALSPTEGLYVYKIITNKYLGELGGVYEA